LKIFIPDECSSKYKGSTTGSNHITHPQLGQGGDREISTDASRLNQGGEGGTGFRDNPTEVDGSSNQIRAT